VGFSADVICGGGVENVRRGREKGEKRRRKRKKDRRKTDYERINTCEKMGGVDRKGE
jgi:hypothetical protein